MKYSFKIVFALSLAFTIYSQFAHPNLLLTSHTQDATNTNKNKPERLLQIPNRDQLRISLDTTDFSSQKAGQSGATNADQLQLAFILKAMQVAKEFYQQRLKVTQMSNIIAPTNCVDFETPTSDSNTGITGSDLHIYVRYITDQSEAYGATGKNCKIFDSNTLPDQTYQHGRPIVGRIIFNTYRLTSGKSLNNRLFASITATALHQTLHILGFDYSLYSTYLDYSSMNGQVYGEVTKLATGISSSRPTTYVIVTPKVKKWAQDFFDCPSMEGMQLENEDQTEPGSHWERVLMYDQLMTATELGAQKGFSGLTFALLEDMGWYDVDGMFNDTNNYGYHKGCDFINNACYSSTPANYFCGTANSSVSRCSSDFLGKAICSNQTALMADGCTIFAEYFHCVDADSNNEPIKDNTFQNYGTDSFCVDLTTLRKQDQDGLNNYQSRCYSYVCNMTFKSITFNIGSSRTIQCTQRQVGAQKDLWSVLGYLTCPNFEDFCVQSRKICPNWCSSKGFCMRGVCNCLQGYSGDDCSQAACNSNQYRSSDGSCVTNCPGNTYANEYSRSCLSCSQNCLQCMDQPQICISCYPASDGNAPYLYQDSQTCLESCPPSTYNDNYVCEPCSQTAHCATCSMADNNCTYCQTSYFLQAPDFGACQQNCPSTYPLKDTVNRKCVDSCTQNLVQSGSTCAMCPQGYKVIGQGCQDTCPQKYFQDEQRRFCQECDSSCLECDGPYGQNCTKCDQTTSQKYLFLKMCIISCPRGTYANSSSYCSACDSGNCATCEQDTGNVVCLSCEYGYYYQNKSCVQSCDQSKFKNTWNHSCDDCDTNCGECTSPSNTSCTACSANKFLLSNSSGGYCLTSCPPGYTPMNGACLLCYSTCLTCIGVNSNQCQSCKDSLYLYSGYCRYVCPPATYPDILTKKCQKCNADCSFCNGPSVNECTACISGLVLSNTTCTDSCPDGTQVNQWGVCYSKYLFWMMYLSVFWLLVS